jgi:hypothetical protein
MASIVEPMGAGALSRFPGVRRIPEQEGNMRTLTMTFGLLVLSAAIAGAQQTRTSPVPHLKLPSAMLAGAPRAELQQSQAQSPHGLSAVQKGAIAGAVGGAAVGLMFSNALCDGSHCPTSGYVTAAAFFGGLGAGIGAGLVYLEQHFPSTPRKNPQSGAVVGVAPVISPSLLGGAFSLQF